MDVVRKPPLQEDQRRRMVQILRSTQPVAVEKDEVGYGDLHDSVRGRFKALAEANRDAEFPSVFTLVQCLGHQLWDMKLTASSSAITKR